MKNNRCDDTRIPWWVGFFATIGVATTGIALAHQLTHFGRKPAAPNSALLPDAGSDEFLDGLSETVGNPILRGGTVRLLRNGDAFFPVFLDDLRNARESIHVMTYIWKDGEVSDQVLDVLIDKAKSGIEVRVLLDALGSHLAPERGMEALREAGGKVVIFSTPLSGSILYVNKRNHRRAFVIDGEIGYTGGMAIADEWLGDEQDSDHWRDTMVRLEGPISNAVQAAFLQLWIPIVGEQLFGPKYFTDPLDGAPSDPAVIELVHSPAGEIQPLLSYFWFSIRAAQKRIYIVNAYYAPDDHIRLSLLEKSRDGVDVRIILPGETMDRKFVRWAAQHSYEELLEAGVRVYEYQPTMLHSKHILIDDNWSIIGSADLGYRSITLNHENVVGIRDAEFGRRMLDMFEEDFRRSKEIRLDEWKERPLGVRAREYLVLGLRAQY